MLGPNVKIACFREEDEADILAGVDNLVDNLKSSLHLPTQAHS